MVKPKQMPVSGCTLQLPRFCQGKWLLLLRVLQFHCQGCARILLWYSQSNPMSAWTEGALVSNMSSPASSHLTTFSLFLLLLSFTQYRCPSGNKAMHHNSCKRHLVYTRYEQSASCCFAPCCFLPVMRSCHAGADHQPADQWQSLLG